MSFQAYYRSKDWRAREREVDAHLARGEVTEHDGVDSFLDHLDLLDAEHPTPTPADSGHRRRTRIGRAAGRP